MDGQLVIENLEDEICNDDKGAHRELEGKIIVEACVKVKIIGILMSNKISKKPYEHTIFLE